MAETTSTGTLSKGPRIQIRLATAHDREVIYRLRHRVYAQELHQHAENAAGRLTDALDAFNLYLVAALGEEIVGFISITPPGRSFFCADVRPGR